MTEATLPIPELRKASRAYCLLTVSLLVAIACLLFIPQEEDPKNPKKRTFHPAAIGSVLFVFGCTVNAARFAYEGGVAATVGGLFIPLYNIVLPFRVSKHTAAVLKHSGLNVGLFGVAGKDWRKLEESRQQSLVLWMREQFHHYLESPDFRAFCGKLSPGSGRAGAKALKEVYRLLALGGQPVIASTVMRNVMLNKDDEAAPALVMGTFDFSKSGWRKVSQVAMSMADPEASPEIAAAVRRIIADDEYRVFRRRRLPIEIPNSDGIFLFDELMRGTDLPDIFLDGERETNPITVLLAMPQEDGPSAVMPRQISSEALKRLIAAGNPPPLPNTEAKFR